MSLFFYLESPKNLHIKRTTLLASYKLKAISTFLPQQAN